MRKFKVILLILLVLPACNSEQSNSFQVRNKLFSPARRITKSYINYIEAINGLGIPILSNKAVADRNSKSSLTQRFQSDENLQYFPATLWQVYSFTESSEWKDLAENFSEIIQTSLITSEPVNAELIQNVYLTPYLVTGDRKYYNILMESLTRQISASEAVSALACKYEDEIENCIEKLLENQLLFFASRETGDPFYRELALKQSEHIFQLYFQNNLSNELFYGLANWMTLPGIEELEKIDTRDLYILSMSFYGFTILCKEVGYTMYGTTTEKLAKVFTTIFESKNQDISDNLDLISKTLVCLAMSNMSSGSDDLYSETSRKILKSLIVDLDQSPKASDQQYSFRMYYYLFECLTKRRMQP